MLTARQIEVMRLRCQGNSLKKIAKLLHVSQWTVKSHYRRIAKATQCPSPAQLGAWAQKNGYLDESPIFVRTKSSGRSHCFAPRL